MAVLKDDKIKFMNKEGESIDPLRVFVVQMEGKSLNDKQLIYRLNSWLHNL